MKTRLVPRMLACALGLALCAAGNTPARQSPAAPPSGGEAARWRADLRALVEGLERTHKDLYHTVTREELARAVARLDARIPSLQRHQVIVEMARLVAMVGDGHTILSPVRDPKVGFRRLPVKLYLFEDGLFVRAADAAHADLVGARVLRVGRATADEAVAAAREIISRDNEMGVKFFAPLYLSIAEVVHALGLADSPERVELTLEKDGRARVVTLAPAGPVDMLPSHTDLTWLGEPGWVDMRDGAGGPPLWLRAPGEHAWFEHVPASKAVYAQINSIEDWEGETFAQFSGRLLAAVEAAKAERLVVDLRLNRGGNSVLIRPLVVGLIRSRVNEPGRLFVLLGRGTWSAAQFLLDELEKYSEATFVGEPSASRGNHFGDSRKFTLPESGLAVRASIFSWQNWHPLDARAWTAPRVAAELTSRAYAENRDPALEAALAYVPEAPLAARLRRALGAGGAARAREELAAFRADRRNRYAQVEGELNDLGYELLSKKRAGDAAVVFEMNAGAHPRSTNAWDSLGEAYEAAGRPDLAAGAYEKAVALDPKNEKSASALRRLRAAP